MLSTKKYIFIFYQQRSVVEQLNEMQESASWLGVAAGRMGGKSFCAVCGYSCPTL